MTDDGKDTFSAVCRPFSVVRFQIASFSSFEARNATFLLALI